MARETALQQEPRDEGVRTDTRPTHRRDRAGSEVTTQQTRRNGVISSADALHWKACEGLLSKLPA